MNTHSDNRDDLEQELNRLLCEGLAAVEPPSAGRLALRGRLLARVGESLAAQVGLLTVRARDGLWRKVKAGVRAKRLWDGPGGSSVLIELQPGAALPVHRHAWLEEGIVLSGGLQLGDLDLGPGDYHVSPQGSRHGRITSRQGAVAYLRGTSLGHPGAMVGELVGGLLPGAGAPAVTVLGTDGTWEPVAEGVDSKLLWRDGDTVSRFFRLGAGACLPARDHGGDEECMMLEGDAFFGDLLVCAGDFHLAPAASQHGPVVSEHGALFFLRSPAGGRRS